MTKYVDAEFERVQETQKEEEIDEEPVDSWREQYKSLMDLSLEADPEIMNARIPFFENENYIDVKLAFMAELDGVTYGIGVPFDPSVAVVIESQDSAAQFLSPDDDENEELMQLMAAQLHEHLGKDLQLKRTPRVLTVDGPLNNYTRNWENQILPRPFTAKELLERDDEQDTVEYFLKVMREELGEEEFQKTMNGDDEDVDDEMMALFDIPGLNKNDEEGLEELMKSMLDEDPDEQFKELEKFGKVEGEETLKLVGYIIPGGKSYTLVQLLRPYVIVGRYIQDDVENRFELLSPEEALVIEPRLAEVCQKDLEKSGLSLSSSMN
ncbi:hypothetical protein FisN_6Hh229 [Fistulifera solaris]|uniref:Uncharacterized protein n=1 Tax=Fistulifera solaris TaxID=1519565 RepID=A0A1Z5K2M0_FISSO|nr:hypothetical protein FisN_6Hh229 [Fistulifera solaris]|eukprot:GAX20278.1 hypothetical protein FisN_6Hh229 [Fistulifera solaris]